MNRQRECSHAEQAIGLALHALEPADEDLLTEHVGHCPICQEHVRQTQDVVCALAATAEQRDPPARLRAALMSAVAATRQLPVDQREMPWSADVPKIPEVAVPASPDRRSVAQPAGHREPSSRPVSSGWSAWLLARRRLIALVATVVVGAVGVGGVVIEMVAPASQQQSALAAPSPEVNRILADVDRAGARHAVLHAPDGQVVAAVAQFPNARQVMPIQLPTNPADHTVYVLWGLGDGPPSAIGAFDVSAPSETMLPVGPVAKAAQYVSYAISIENGRSVPASPGLIVASGRVES